jgi:hypothetical protein
MRTRILGEGHLLLLMYLPYKLFLNNNNTKNNNNNNVNSDNEHWYDQVPKSVEASREGKLPIIRNQQLQTDRTISF